MQPRHFLRALLGRILTPSYVSTILWLLTDTIEFVILGVALSVVLAVAAPLLETAAEWWAELRRQREAAQRHDCIAALVAFLNRYKAALTRYPPDLLPADLARSVMDQIALFAQYLRTLKGLRIKHYATSYDAVHSLMITSEDFVVWDLPECEAFLQHSLAELSEVATAPWQHVLQRFGRHRLSLAWKETLAMVERKLDTAVRHTLTQWRFMQQASIDPTMQQDIKTLLRSGSFHRQAGLKAYLTAHCPASSEEEIDAAITSFQYEAVVESALALLEPTSSRAQCASM
jgi:hypothetical protein